MIEVRFKPTRLAPEPLTTMCFCQWVRKLPSGGSICFYFFCRRAQRIVIMTKVAVWAHLPSFIREGNGNPLQYSCLENPRDGGAWWADVSGVAQSQTQLKQLSSSSIIYLILLMRKLRPRPNPRSKNKGMVETKTSSSAMILHGATLMFFLSTTPLQIQLITASSRICVAHTERDRAHFPT